MQNCLVSRNVLVFLLINKQVFFADQALTDILSNVVEENQRRDSELCHSCIRLQCLRCRSEFTLQGGDDEEDAGEQTTKRRGAVILSEGVQEQDGEELIEAQWANKGESEFLQRSSSTVDKQTQEEALSKVSVICI